MLSVPSPGAWPVALLAAMFLAALAVVPAAAGVSTEGARGVLPGSPPGVDRPPVAYAGPESGESTSANPAADRPGRRLWFHDGAWWALMVSAADDAVRIHELMPDHTWRRTDTVVPGSPESVGDAVSEGARVYVVAEDGDLNVDRLTYDEESRSYRADDGFPVEIAAGSGASATLAVDGHGVLYAAWLDDQRVWMARSDSEGTTWDDAMSLTPDPLAGATPEALMATAFDGGVGVMWSDQAAQRFQFAVHRDVDPPDAWTLETPLEGENMVDDHVSLAAAPPGSGATVLAAVKTSLNHAGDLTGPQVLVLQRSADGTWASAVGAAVRDRVTHPLLLVDGPNRRVHLFLQSPTAGGTIRHKSASLTDVSFPAGPGEPWLTGEDAVLANHASTGELVDAWTGMVVLATDVQAGRYWHGEQALPVPPGGVGGTGDETPPPVPENLDVVQAPGDVSLRWSSVMDEAAGWAPAGDRRLVGGYVVLRDGVEIATVPVTHYTDTSVSRGERYEYAVAAVDMAGNRSPSLSREVIIENGSGREVWAPVSLGLLGVAAFGVLAFVAVDRRRGGHHEAPRVLTGSGRP